MGIIKGKDLSMAGFSLFRPGNASPAANNLSLLRKISKYLEKNNPGIILNVRMDSAGYNHRIMRYCDKEGHGFVIAGDKYEIVLDTIAAIAEITMIILFLFKLWILKKEGNDNACHRESSQQYKTCGKRTVLAEKT